MAEHSDGWRAWVKLGRDRVVFGPTHYGRAGRREAEADLAQARQASTREEMQSCLQNLRDGAARAAMPSAATSGVAQSSDSSGVKQPAARSKHEEGAQTRKRLCLGAQAPTSPATAESNGIVPVSYTHLTLPTILLV